MPIAELARRIIRQGGPDLTPLRVSRDFRVVFAGSGISAIGSWVTYVTIPYQVYLLTDDPLLVGLLGLCEIAPLLVMALVGGALADFADRRRLVLVGEVASRSSPPSCWCTPRWAARTCGWSSWSLR